ncbi:MAG: FAD-dependent oxidoreductase [Gemmatimonadetes bacterium]|nr:FAD-dependent oxidoreductase [Gemmatimonadota bacterium]
MPTLAADRLLPPHLAERITRHGTIHDAPPGGAFVLYWMRTAVRAHENPALDAALEAGAALGVPVFVYHALSERYPFASDRHHRFILEGARDVAAECAARGIGYAFHLERPGHRAPALRLLAARAALVVTETMPIPPLSGWTAALAAQAPCPVWSVDTACVVPMPLVGRAHTRAFAFRDATAALREARVARPWPAAAAPASAFVPEDLPFAPVSLADADMGALVAACAIDHGVPPVAEFPGGSVAGYARWDAFVRRGALDRYAADRNDPTRDGVSGMSPYLHYGMVSPFRLARACAARAGAARTGEGAAKYLDELLIWRELAWSFCHWHPDPASLAALPGWARETLAAHAADARDTRSWEVLARGRTGDRLWDAAQRSLLRHGMLHNNLRMTWGKAIPGWSASPEEALARLEDLNHRYALDGRDPSSYGGLLWCLGQFDRPFPPAVPVLGTVRPRPTRAHAARLDVARYEALVARPAPGRPRRVLVVGAGIAGLACARTLQDAGVEVTVLDKGRGVGGRTSTRRGDGGTFDHGAPDFAAHDPRLALWLDSWCADGVLRPVTRGFAGTPGMNALARHLAAGLSVETGATVTALRRTDGGWEAQDAAGGRWQGEALVVAVPAPQAAALLRSAACAETDALASRLDTVEMSPCWSTMVTLDGPLPVRGRELLADGRLPASLTAGEARLAVAVREADKPGRPASECWTVQASAAWSATHLEDAAADVAAAMGDALVTALATALGPAVPGVAQAVAHRWRYARVTRGLEDACLAEPALRVGAAGDFGATPDVEGAWLSGVALAGRLLGG